MKGSKPWILAAVCAMLFAALGTYGYRQYVSIERQKNLLVQENQALDFEKEKIAKETVRAEEEIKSLEEETGRREKEVLKQQKIIEGYENTLSGLEVYQAQAESVRDSFEEILNYQPNPLDYNFDQAVAEDNAQKGRVFNTLSNIFPGIMGYVFSTSVEGMGEENTNILAEVNQKAQDILLSPRQEVEKIVNQMNVRMDMYDALVNVESVEEQFVNLQVLEKACQTQPIDDSLLEADRQRFMECLKDYYIRLRAVHDLYAFVLTDTISNQAYLEKMESDLLYMENLFSGQGADPMEHLTGEQISVLLQIQQTMKGIIDALESKRAVLPSIPISNQGFSDFQNEGRASRVYHYEKNMESGKVLIYLLENRRVGGGNCQTLYDLKGEPVYVEVNGAHAYFYNGVVLESDMDGDMQQIYQRAVYMHENFYSLTKEAYFEHTLFGM